HPSHPDVLMSRLLRGVVAETRVLAASSTATAADSPRWCATCESYGDHHTDRHGA
ncbi:MAG: hypothetical protein JWM36_4894, partial [Hyphomicrobiales bacterium]|nr:hypothetical protein [Hyphomicrobiales bacterium]